MPNNNHAHNELTHGDFNARLFFILSSFFSYGWITGFLSWNYQYGKWSIIMPKKSFFGSSKKPPEQSLKHEVLFLLPYLSYVNLLKPDRKQDEAQRGGFLKLTIKTLSDHFTWPKCSSQNVQKDFDQMCHYVFSGLEWTFLGWFSHGVCLAIK